MSELCAAHPTFLLPCSDLLLACCAAMVEIITGRGLHSENGEARVRPMVRQYLEDNGLHFAEEPGSYKVFFHA